MTHKVTIATRATLERVQQAYAELIKGATRFSLLELFSWEQFRLEAYCRLYQPNPCAELLKQEIEQFCRRYDIWLPSAKHYITCAIYLFPTAPLERMVPMVANLAIDYYLNDTAGREVFAKLTSTQRRRAQSTVHRMSVLDEQLSIPPDAHPVEQANAEILAYIRNTSPQSWFREFLRLYAYHIGITHRDCSATAEGRIPSVKEYIENRCHIAGMYHVISLLEYSEGQFLDWGWLSANGITAHLQRLHYVTAAIGGLMNDLFSFEKEVIDNASDSNLVLVIALNDPGLSLEAAITQAAVVVRNLLMEFLTLVAYVREICSELATDPALLNCINLHLDGLERCVQASWVWEVHTMRYKREQAIFNETLLTTNAGITV